LIYPAKLLGSPKEKVIFYHYLFPHYLNCKKIYTYLFICQFFCFFWKILRRL